MIINTVLFFILCIGFYFLMAGLFPKVSINAENAVKARSGKKETTSEQFIKWLSPKIVNQIHLEKTKRLKLLQTLHNLNIRQTPELIHAKSIATGLIVVIGILIILPFVQIFTFFIGIEIAFSTTLQIGLIFATIMFFVGKNDVFANLEKQVKEKRTAIEWELPQFSGTVVQQLAQNKNVSATQILESYQKISGKYLKEEINLTLNEMRTGDHEQAIKALGNRINSGAFTQVVQGFISLLRGDNQYNYFQMITNNFEVLQAQLIKRELQKRPEKLTINNILLLVGMIAMFGVAIGGYLMDASAMFF